MDVLQAAWLAAGSPIPDRIRFDRTGSCGRCGQIAAVTADEVVSAKFTGWCSWQRPDPQLCVCCTWGYRGPGLRDHSFLITAAPSFQQLSAAELVEVLEEPIQAGTAVVLPLHRNRKHTLPTAYWGRLAVDEISVPWSAEDASRLVLMRWLRRRGFGSAALAKPAPAFRPLAALPAAEQTEVMRRWAELDPWRPASPWLAAGVLAVGMAYTAIDAA